VGSVIRAQKDVLPLMNRKDCLYIKYCVKIVMQLMDRLKGNWVQELTNIKANYTRTMILDMS